MASSSGSRMIQLKASDNEIYSVEEAIAKQSGVIRNFLEDWGDSNVLIPLPNVRGRTLRMVMEWIKKHAAEEKLEEKEVQDWETKFVELDLDVTYELIMAANYLEVNGLLHRLCQKVADIIAGKQPEEIRRIFNIENDFSPEEEAEIRKQNAWAFDSTNN